MKHVEAMLSELVDEQPDAFAWALEIERVLESGDDERAASELRRLASGDDAVLAGLLVGMIIASRDTAPKLRTTGRPPTADPDEVRRVVDESGLKKAAAIEQLLVDRFGVHESTARRWRRRL